MSTGNEAPRNDLEEALADWFSSLLNVQTVGIHDNFFALGGDSVLMALLINRIRDRFDVDIPISLVFEVPTIESLALSIQNLQKASPGLDTDIATDISEN